MLIMRSLIIIVLTFLILNQTVGIMRHWLQEAQQGVLHEGARSLKQGGHLEGNVPRKTPRPLQDSLALDEPLHGNAFHEITSKAADSPTNQDEGLERSIAEIEQAVKQSSTKLQAFLQNNAERGKQTSPAVMANDSVSITRQSAWKNASDAMLTESEIWTARQTMVKLATMAVWSVYEKHAFGHDELTPLTLQGQDNGGGLGMMILESLDTLKMMGHNLEYLRASRWVTQNLSVEHPVTVKVSEVVRKAVGGLLSAHDLSDDDTFLHKAALISLKLLKAFEGGVFASNKASLGGKAINDVSASTVYLGEFGTMQLEMFVISQRLGITEIGDLADYPTRFLQQTHENKNITILAQGILPVAFERKSGVAHNQDSKKAVLELQMGNKTMKYYETLLNMWIITGRKDEALRKTWQRAVGNALELLVGASRDKDLMIGKRKGSRVEALMDHDVCALPGMMALGMTQGAIDIRKLWFYMNAAVKLMDTCWKMYERTATGNFLYKPRILGLAPGEIHIDLLDMQQLSTNSPEANLAPEFVKSLLYMWRVTKDSRYMEMGWSIFQAIERHCRTHEGAFATVQHVNGIPVRQLNSLPTHVIGQTLKYLWLLFGKDVEYSPNNGWLFNTEGHPVLIIDME